MPVVRELVNRITFKLNPGDKEKVEKSFLSLKGKALAVVTAVSGIGAKMYTEFEKNEAITNFFSRGTEEAEKFRNMMTGLKGNEIISDREIAQAKAQLAKLIIPPEDIERILPILADITVARPDLDFNAVIDLVTRFVKGGDIEALEQLGAIGKDTANSFRLAQLDMNTAVKGQTNLFNFLSESLEGNRDKIKENADEVKNTLGFQFSALAKQVSDFNLRFGKESAGPIGEVVRDITAMIKELNASETLWNTIRASLEITREIYKDIKNMFSGAIKDKTGEKPLFDFGNAEENEKNFDKLLDEQTKKRIEDQKKIFSTTGFTGFPSLSPTEQKSSVSIDITGAVKVVGEGLTGLYKDVDTALMGPQITEFIVSKVKEGFDKSNAMFRNVAAQNGALVTESD